MKNSKRYHKLTVVLGCAALGLLAGAGALGGCTAEAPDETLSVEEAGEAQQAIGCLSSPPTNDCLGYEQVGGQWCFVGYMYSGAFCAESPNIDAGRCDGSGTCVAQWEQGTFRTLADGNPDDLGLLDFVTSLPHGTSFTPFDSTRQAAFDAFVDAMIGASAEGLADANAPDWCNVAQLAYAAGYDVTRFFDWTTGRWLVYSYDTQDTGHGYFFYNPEPRRALAVEAPHVGSPGSVGEDDTQRQGVYLFETLGARALLINGADRCSGSTSGTCGGTYTGDVCGSGTGGTSYHASDVAHSVTNAFHRFHARLDAVEENRFVQLHGRNVSGKHVTANDGRNDNPSGTSSMANDFKAELEALDSGSQFTTLSCQDGTASTYCGETNVQGRLTANGNPNGACFYQGSDGTRFLHLEQGTGFLAGGSSTPTSKSWPEIADALRQVTPCLQTESCDDALPGQPWYISALGCEM